MTHYIKKIDQVKFSFMSPEDIRKMSVVTVEYPDTYGDDGFPIEKGLMDPRLGVIDPSLICRTCGLKGGECQGHFGSIELARPVIHVGFGDMIHKLLRSTCNECSRILLNDEQIEFYRDKIRKTMDNKKSINSILKNVFKDAKRELRTLPHAFQKIDMEYCCPHCGAPQEPIVLDKPTTIRQGDYKLTPAEVRDRLEKISNEDAYVLGVNTDIVRPEWLVLTVLPVPPVTVRPSITLETGERREDDLTHKLVDVLRINQRLLENMEAGAPHLIVEDLWELLQYHVTTYFDNDASGVPPARHRSGRPLKTLMQRFHSHGGDVVHDKSRGRFRENILGKYVNFSARTVISPDPNISINEVGVPLMLAKSLTIPETVTPFNIDKIAKFVENGPNVYPGANYVLGKNSKRKIFDETKNYILEQLEPGNVVERHLMDGDIVLLNRQPSLHKLSLMAHKVKIIPQKTFTINPAICPPYNADFDGDEMNIHVLQTLESRAEAKSLLYAQENMISPKSGLPIIGAIRDHISGIYLLTCNELTFNEEEALQFIRRSGLKMPSLEDEYWILKQDSNFNKESFIYKKKGDNWDGKELFSLTLPNDLNMSFSSGFSGNQLNDDKVIIENGILKQGIIDEVAIGSLKGKLLYKIFKDYGSAIAKDFLESVTKLSLCVIMNVGLTNCLSDYEISDDANEMINNYFIDMYNQINSIIQSSQNSQMFLKNNYDETLDSKISVILKDSRDYVGWIAGKSFNSLIGNLPFSLFGYNSSVMAHTGSKSSRLNITQITACVGQQSVRGHSLSFIFNDRGYEKRLLPHFKKGEFNVKSMGFVKSSFLKGLDPVEFFMHAISGRDTMADKAIRVSISGYMQRRLVNALQDVRTDKNGTVKDNWGNVIQTLYGEDGVDPVKSDFGKSLDLNRLIDELRIEKSVTSHYSENDLNNNSNDDYSENLSDDETKLKINSKNISSSNDKIHSGNVEKLLGECNKYFNRPMFMRQLKKYNLDDGQLSIIKKDIDNDIVNLVIIDENTDFKTLIKTRCEEYRKNYSDFDENEIDDILNGLTFPEIDGNIIDECKNKVKNDFLEGKITINQVELKLNNYINKKIIESDQLKELEMIKNNPNVPSIKIHLTQNEVNEIYIVVENEIVSKYGIRGNVETRVDFLLRKKIRENQSEARARLNVIKRDFSNLIRLNDEQQVKFINQIEYYINNHQIKYSDVSEDYIIELSENFIKNGQIKLR